MRKENFDIKLSLENIENIHKGRISSVKANFREQHNSILSNQTNNYKRKIDEALDRQMNLQSQLHETKKRSSFLREQVDALLNQNRILSSKLTNFNDLKKIFSSRSSPINLRVAPLRQTMRSFPLYQRAFKFRSPPLYL